MILRNSKKKLEKLSKLSPHARFLKTDQHRTLFTKHGLHYNRLGKQYLLHQVALMICTLFMQNPSPPISLDWNEPEASEVKLPNRTTTHDRKSPVTRSTDCLW